MDAVVALLGHSLESPAVQRWLAGLGPLEEEVISSGDGETPEHYLCGRAAGVIIGLGAHGRIDTVFFMSDGKDGCAQYRGDLGPGLSFSASPDDVIRALGRPTVSGRPQLVSVLNKCVGAHMRFDYPKHSLHFEFRPDSTGVEMVTLMVADITPGRRNAG